MSEKVLFSVDNLWAEQFYVFCTNSTLSDFLWLRGGMLHILVLSVLKAVAQIPSHVLVSRIFLDHGSGGDTRALKT